MNTKRNQSIPQLVLIPKIYPGKSSKMELTDKPGNPNLIPKTHMIGEKSTYSQVIL